jgi:hypothetical protein
VLKGFVISMLDFFREFYGILSIYLYSYKTHISIKTKYLYYQLLIVY